VFPLIAIGVAEVTANRRPSFQTGGVDGVAPRQATASGQGIRPRPQDLAAWRENKTSATLLPTHNQLERSGVRIKEELPD
jgi:hypothetical protein